MLRDNAMLYPLLENEPDLKLAFLAVDDKKAMIGSSLFEIGSGKNNKILIFIISYSFFFSF